ncbi:metallophosphoesterase [Paractinoplanes aksuensis]|uniref:metallophosphoesterase n=1 Tax=Paractinoplanes aksuensis TaxID=2939490 RepID=UPI00209C1AD2|nr:metallophosphoesterase [Actinoplanes aksuensis]
MIMPFGVRPLIDGTDHDFDAFYSQVLRPVALNADFDVLRVDEIDQVGTITNQAFKQLYAADIVVADVSAPNSNVYYELGVRQALSSGATILVAERGADLPFDIASQRVLLYDRDFLNDTAFRDRFRNALAVNKAPMSNPVQDALKDIGVAPDPQKDQAAFEREFASKIARATRDEQLVAVWHWAKQFQNLPVSGLLSLANGLARVEDYKTAAGVLGAAYPVAEEDYEVHRQRGFYLRKFGDYDGGLRELNRALELNPHDPQTLGMLGGTVKRQHKYAEALNYYERAVRLAPSSLYLRVAHAGMVMLAYPDESHRARELYEALNTDVENSEYLVGDYWADLVATECNFVLGNFDRAYERAADAIKNGAHPADAQSSAEQIRMLGEVGVHNEQAVAIAEWLVLAARSDGKNVSAPRLASAGDLSSQHLIFHISDTHFGTLGEPGNARQMHRYLDDENSQRLSLELRDEFRRVLTQEGCDPKDSTIVLSGDSVYSGTLEEFKLVADFLAELCDETGIGRDQVVIVPGNHDIDWDVAKADLKKRFDNYLSFVHQFYGENLFRKIYPLITWNFQVSSARPEPSEIVSLQQRGPITFVGLNSCVFEDHQHHYGYVGLKQLKRVAELLPDANSGEVMAAVMHHHLLPYPEPLMPARKAQDVMLDMSTVRDAGIVEQRLSRLGFSLVLHGHKHKPQLRETAVRQRAEGSAFAGRSLIVSGCGSTGVSEQELEHNQSNHFAVIKLLRNRREAGADFVRVDWREMAVQLGAEWAPAGRWVVKG